MGSAVVFYQQTSEVSGQSGQKDNINYFLCSGNNTAIS